MGGRRGQDGLGVDRHQVPSAAQCRPAPGAPREGTAPPARVRPGLARRCHRPRPGPGHRLGEKAPDRVLHGQGRGVVGLPGLRHGLRGLLPGPELLGAAGRPRRGRERRRGAQGVAQRVLRVELHRDVAGADDPRPGLGLHRGGRAQPPRARPLRDRLRRGQGATGPHGSDRRVGPHLGPAPGRRPRRDGDPEPQRPRRRHPPRPAVQCLGRL